MNIKNILPPFKIVPNSINNKLIVTIFNKVFAQAILDGELDFLTNKWVQIKVTDIGLDFTISFENGAIIYKRHHMNDLTISGKSCDFLDLIAKKQDPDTLFFQRKLKMTGNTELGLYIKNFLDAFDTDSNWISKNSDKTIKKGYPFFQKILRET